MKDIYNVLGEVESIRNKFNDLRSSGNISMKEKTFLKLEFKYKYILSSINSDKFLDSVFDYCVFLYCLLNSNKGKSSKMIKIFKNEVKNFREKVKKSKQEVEVIGMLDVTTDANIGCLEDKLEEKFNKQISNEKESLKNEETSSFNKSIDEIVDKAIYDYDFLSCYE